MSTGSFQGEKRISEDATLDSGRTRGYTPFRSSPWKVSPNGYKRQRRNCSLKVEIRAAEQSIVVLKPTTSHRRYDIVLDCGGKFHRVQVKWAGSPSVKAAGSFLLDLRKVTRGGQRSKLFYSRDEIDVILVYLPSIDALIWLGAEVFHGRETLTIRTAPTKNGQMQKCLMAANYLW